MSECILNDREFHLFRELIYKACGITLSDGKRSLVQSRLHKRLSHYNLKSFHDYYELVTGQGKNGDELKNLINCITTNKTDFFREAHHFDFVTSHIVPELIQSVQRGQSARRLRIWHAGCSTGEEPYTLAMTLLEAFEGDGTWDIRQLASDIDTNVLDTAKRGVYEADKVSVVPETLLRKYFLRGSGENSRLYKARQEMRELMTFRQINLLDDTWPIRNDVRFDIIFCRNVVIYFDKATQRRLFARFAERLRPGGYLFIGHSESLLGISEAFDSMGRTIYQLPPMAGVRSNAA